MNKLGRFYPLESIAKSFLHFYFYPGQREIRTEWKFSQPSPLAESSEGEKLAS